MFFLQELQDPDHTMYEIFRVDQGPNINREKSKVSHNEKYKMIMMIFRLNYEKY